MFAAQELADNYRSGGLPRKLLAASHGPQRDCNSPTPCDACEALVALIHGCEKYSSQDVAQAALVPRCLVRPLRLVLIGDPKQLGRTPQKKLPA